MFYNNNNNIDREILTIETTATITITNPIGQWSNKAIFKCI